MVFTADMLLEENYVAPTEVKLMTSDVIANESYFSEALVFINEMNTDINNAKKDLYRTMLESGGSEYIIHEAFSGFKDAIKKIIDKFIEFIKRLAAKFGVFIHKLVKSDKYIKDNKSKFNDFGSEHEFDMSIYTFTRLDDANFPVPNIINDYGKDSYSTTLQGSSDGKITGTDIYNSLKTVYDNITSDSSDFYDKFRGKVLGKDGESFTGTEFEEELFEAFRNGDSSPSKETINHGRVITALDRFMGYDKSIKAVEELKKNLEKEYKGLKNKLKEVSTDSLNDNSLIKDIFSNIDQKVTHKDPINSKKNDIDVKLDQINKALISRVETMCSIHSIAFTKKLDAIKAAFSQDKKILYGALSRMTKKPKNESTFIDDIEMPALEVNSDPVRISESTSYTQFLIEYAQNQNDIINYINECVVLERGDIDGLRAINESVIDTIKSIIRKIIDSVKDFFSKFRVGMSKLFTTDKNFLAKYKDIILKKPFKNRDLTVYDYKIDQINKYVVPKFETADLSDLIDKGTTEFEANFAEKYNTRGLNGINNKPSNEDLKDRIVIALKGEDQIETNMQAYESKKAAMYNFCVNIEATLDTLDKDLATVKTNESSINGEIARHTKELEAQAATQESVYSSVLGTYIHEDDKMKIGGDNDKSKSSFGGGNKPKGTSQINTSANKVDSGSVSGAGEDLKVKAVSNADGNTDKEKTTNAAAKLKEYQEFAGNYFKECNKILYAKKEIIEAAYKDYIKILKTHVSDYGGKMEEKSTSVIGDGNAAHKSATFGENGQHRIQYYLNLKCTETGANRVIGDGKSGILSILRNNKKETVELQSDRVKEAAAAAAELKGSAVEKSDVFTVQCSDKDGNKTEIAYCIFDGDNLYPIEKSDMVVVNNA